MNQSKEILILKSVAGTSADQKNDSSCMYATNAVQAVCHLNGKCLLIHEFIQNNT